MNKKMSSPLCFKGKFRQQSVLNLPGIQRKYKNGTVAVSCLEEELASCWSMNVKMDRPSSSSTFSYSTSFISALSLVPVTNSNKENAEDKTNKFDIGSAISGRQPLHAEPMPEWLMRSAKLEKNSWHRKTNMVTHLCLAATSMEHEEPIFKISNLF